MKRWSIRAIAQRSGRSRSLVHEMARAGLLPGYRGSRQGVPGEVAEPFAVVMRHGAYSSLLARTLQNNPRAVLEAGEALRVLARAELAWQEEQQELEAA